MKCFLPFLQIKLPYWGGQTYCAFSSVSIPCLIGRKDYFRILSAKCISAKCLSTRRRGANVSSRIRAQISSANTRVKPVFRNVRQTDGQTDRLRRKVKILSEAAKLEREELVGIFNKCKQRRRTKGELKLEQNKTKTCSSEKKKVLEQKSSKNVGAD